VRVSFKKPIIPWKTMRIVKLTSRFPKLKKTGKKYLWFEAQHKKIHTANTTTYPNVCINANILGMGFHLKIFSIYMMITL